MTDTKTEKKLEHQVEAAWPQQTAPWSQLVFAALDPAQASRGVGVSGWVMPYELKCSLESVAIQRNMAIDRVLLGLFHLLVARACPENQRIPGISILGANGGYEALTYTTERPEAISIETFLTGGVQSDTGRAEIEAPFLGFGLFALESSSTSGVQQSEHAIFTGPLECALVIERQRERLCPRFIYNRQYFGPKNMARLARQYQNLIKAWLEKPQQNCKDIEGFCESSDFVEPLIGQVRYLGSPAETVTSRFQAQARARAESLAIIELPSGKGISYRELDARANQAAHRLTALGAGSETPVAICLDRGIDLIVWTLAILKTGSAYLPLDPTYPAIRLNFMLKDSCVKILLTQLGFASHFTDTDSEMILVDDGLTQAFPKKWVARVRVLPDQLAYVIYTSGSTGVPKGVRISHRNIISFVTSEFVAVGPEETFLQTAAFSFDAATLEIWGSLLNGGRLVMMPPGPYTLAALGVILLHYQITMIFVTSGLFRVLVEEQLEDLASLRCLVTGGDVISPRHIAMVCERWPDLAMVAAYGPTETTCITTAHVAKRRHGDTQAMPIGLRLPHSVMYVVDDALQLVEDGRLGELCIGGNGLARDYQARPSITAAHFVPDPFSSVPGVRLYRTGDLVSRDASSRLSFIERIDGQIKLRGFRLETGEVEAVISQFAGVLDVLVMGREIQPGDKRLVAFLRREPPVEIDVAKLRDFLRSRLPDYMIPVAFRCLSHFPLTVNGKVDRKALPEIEFGAISDENQVPENAHEKALAQIWEKVLGVATVGLADNFFELGGDSISGLQAVAQAKAAGYPLTLKALFTLQTISAISREDPDSANAPDETMGFQVGYRAFRAQGSTTSDQTLKGFPLAVGLDDSRLDAILERYGQVDAILATTPVQAGMILHSQLSPNDATYADVMYFKMKGVVDRDRLHRAWLAVVTKYGALRTVFDLSGETPLQVVLAVPDFSWMDSDYRDLEPEEADVALDRISETERKHVFDFQKKVPLRITLAQTADHWHLWIGFHHAILDGWSLGLLKKDLEDLYLGRDPAGDLIRVQSTYADYIAWLLDQNQAKAEAFWRDYLEGFEKTSSLPVLREESRATRRHEWCRAWLDPEKTCLANNFAKHHGITINTVFQGAWALLLHRYGCGRDVLFGVTISGRPPGLSDCETMVGLMVNAMPLRVGIQLNLGTRKWLQEVQKQNLAFEGFEFSSLAQIQKLVKTPHDQALFSTLVAFENFPGYESLYNHWFGDAVVAHDEWEQIHYPQVLQIVATDRIAIRLRFDGRRFDEAYAKTVLGDYLEMVESLITNGNVLVAEHLHRNRVPRCHPVRHFEVHGGIHQRFEAMVAASPKAIALSLGEEVQTYEGLNRAANKIADSLLTRGMSPGTMVALFFNRSFSLMASLLGVLKAGGVYVPLDPTNPPERLNLILEDANAPYILTVGALKQDLPARANHAECLLADMILMDETWTAPNPALDILSQAPAYVIYTSGSTGQPKGVQVAHRHVLRLLDATQERYQFDTSDVWTLFHSPAFDFSVWEIWGALCSGARLVIVPYWVSRSPSDFYELLMDEEVTVLNQTPSSFRALIAQESMNPWGDLIQPRWVIFGGEALDLQSLKPWFESRSDESCRLVNMYGITETCVHVTACEITAKNQALLGMSPLGDPISDLTVQVLDAQMQTVPSGVPGEICVGGAGPAHGYLNSPGLTAMRYVPDPFSLDAGGRLYRSGDVAVRMPDGSLYYAGRQDQQMKVRGFRIEPGEIEAALCQMPQIQDARVLMVLTQVGDPQIYAFVVGEDLLATKEMREYLSDLLPSYMIPSRILQVPAFPLTGNGKVDRKALLAMTEDAVSAPGLFLQPVTRVQKVLAEIWKAILKVAQVGLSDNFFELGGHSLLAGNVQFQIKQQLGIELPVRAVFDTPNLEVLAALVEHYQTGAEKEDESKPEKAPEHARNLLSPLQERLWFFYQMQPDSPVYNIPIALRIRGPLDRELAHQCFAQVVKRHQALAARFTLEGNQPRQNYAEDGSFGFVYGDLRGLSDPENALRKHLAEDAHRGFDLMSSPLMRVHLYQLADRDWALLVNIHHIVADGQSWQIMFTEWATLYKHQGALEKAELPALPLQYADFSHWNWQGLNRALVKAELDFWMRTLADAPPHITLPLDKKRPAEKGHRGRLFPFDLPEETVRMLDAFCAANKVTPFMVLVSVYALVLGRYARQGEVCVGTPVTDRKHRTFDGLIGFFVNMVVLRLPTDQMGDKANFLQIIARTKEIVLAAISHQQVPFDRIVNAVKPQRDLSRSPLFQVMFSLEETSACETLEQAQLNELTIEEQDFDYGVAKVDLTLYIRRKGPTVKGVLEYSTDLFERSSAARMAEYYTQLLGGVLGQPRLGLSAISMLAPAAEQRLLQGWGVHTPQLPKQMGIHGCFERVVAQKGDDTALTLGETDWSFAMLNIQANRLAHFLLRHGYGRGDRIAIQMGPSAELIVGLLAILKIGAAYVPIDVDYPQERVKTLLGLAEVDFILGLRRHLEYAELGVGVGYLDENWGGDLPHSNPAIAVPANALAYIVFTSGSTGKPKGVMVSHPNVLRLVFDTHYIQPQPDHVYGLLSNPTFDALTFEVWGSLLNGCRLCPIAKATLLDLETFVHLRKRLGINVMFITTAMFNIYARSNPEVFDGMRYVLFGGEIVDASTVAQVLRRRSIDHLLHVYGPTESTTFSSWYLIGAVGKSGVTVPIGKPIAHTRLMILNDQLRPVPIGVPGELWIGGEGLAFGYLAAPALTGVSFIPDPFAQHPGARLYRSGDLAKFDSQGDVVFIGRVDHQIKLRGFRIELGEIEHALGACEGVEDVVVLLKGDDATNKYLAAYLVGRALSLEHLKNELAATLPEYMLPTTYTVLKAFPLNRNRKIDMAALPEPTLAFSPTYVPLQTTMEKAIAEIWSDILDVPRVGRNDHFFELGGHSLAATRVLTALNTTLELPLKIRQLFEMPVLRVFAEAAEKEATQKNYRALVAPKCVSRNMPLPLSSAQARMWFLEQLEQGTPVYNMPFALRIEGNPDLTCLRQAMKDLVLRHEILRTYFCEMESEGVRQPKQVISPQADGPFRVIDLQAIEWASALCRALIRREGMTPFCLETGPLLRVTVFRLSENESLLVINMHHMIGDGWSVRVLLEEWCAYYRARVSGQDPDLPPLSCQYADMAVWQKQWMASAQFAEGLTWWASTLRDLPAPLALPTDRPRPSGMGYQGDHIRLPISGALTQKLQAFSSAKDSSIFMTTLAAFSLLLARYTGQTELCIGTPIANRTLGWSEKMIGVFINTLVLKLNQGLEGEATFSELLAHVRQVALDAYAHQTIPFEKVVERVQPSRSMDVTPLFQVMFSHEELGIEAGFDEWPGMRMSWETFEYPVSKFELSLSFMPDGEGFEAVFSFNTALFERTSVVRMAGHYHQLLESIVACKAIVHRELTMISADETAQLETWWHGPKKAWHWLGSYTAGFESNIEQFGEFPALMNATDSLNYDMLNRESNRWARLFQQRGVAGEKPVGVCLDSDLSLLKAILAILKAGGTYVPMAANLPEDRVRAVMADLAMDWILVQGEKLPWLTPEDGRLSLEDMVFLSRDQSEQDLGIAIDSRQLAYVIYTSGSTGRPKGVGISHGALVNHTLAVIAKFRLTRKDRVFQFSNLSFDISIEEIFPTLASGACLVLHPHGAGPSCQEFTDLVARFKITVVNLPTAFWHEWTRYLVWAQAALPDHLRLVIVGGEKASPEILAIWQKLPGCQPEWFNAYGPTETTVTATWFRIDPVNPPSQHLQDLLPIGRPIANVSAFLWSPMQGAVPQGIASELLIGGAGLARGYLGRPGLTAGAFRPHPLSAESGARIYHSGDLARFGEDGELQILGRGDRQEKIRGYRIELGEIEHQLKTHPQVDLALVRVVGEGVQRHLVAYVVCSFQTQTTQDVDAGKGGVSQAQLTYQLRAFLIERLPDFMVPNHLLILATLPLTANGKVDVAKLPKPEIMVEPKTRNASHTEALLMEIWRAELHVSAVGVSDNFFELGGHSLLATQIIYAIDRVFGVALPLATVFQTQSLTELAAAIDETFGKPISQGTIPIEMTDRNEPLPASMGQERLWFLMQMDPESWAYNMPFAFVLQGEVDVARLQGACLGLMQRHEILRTLFRERDGQVWLRIEAVPEDPFNFMDVSDEDAPEKLALQTLAALVRKPFDLKEGPLFRVMLVKIAAQRHYLFFNLHHIIFDGWSMRILLRDLAELFASSTEQGQVAAELQFADVAQWQRQTLAGEMGKCLTDFWHRQLEGVPAQLVLPGDPDPAGAGQGCTLPFQIPEVTVSQLHRLCQKHQVTPFMVLLGAYAVFLARHCDQWDFCIGTPSNGRENPSTQDMLGFFVNMLAIRMRLHERESQTSGTFLAVLEMVRKTTIATFAHLGMPYAYLVEDGEAGHQTGRKKLIQAVFALDYEDGAEDALQLEGMICEPLAIDFPVAKFDLSLHMKQSKAGLWGYFNFDLGQFDLTTGQRFVPRFVTLLGHAMNLPEQDIRTIRMLPAAEKTLLLQTWNATKAELPECTIHGQFERGVCQWPDAVALVDGAQSWTYSALNQHADLLAQMLVRDGLVPGERVGLCLHPSMTFMASLLAILKAGCVYVPIDTNYPAARVQFILCDSGIRILVAEPGLELGDLEGISRINPHQFSKDVVPVGLPPTSASQRAYITYTSGTTGRPKGVMVTHRNVMRLVSDRTYLQIGPSDVVAQASNTTFDALTFEVWTALLHGARLVLIPKERLIDPESLRSQLKREKVGVLFTTTALFNQFARQTPKIFAGMKDVLFGGEQVDPTSVASILENGKPENLLHVYGPTESTTFATWHAVDRVTKEATNIPIGRGIENTYLYLLDQQCQLVPAGVTGEIHIGGEGLAHGYLGRPGLTASKFLPNPFAMVPGERLYKTGDFARFSAAGEMLFIGRNDRQIKLRGFRIELGEIETRLGHHPAVISALVRTHKDGMGEKSLVAYVQTGDHETTTLALVDHLRRQVPDYMVPAKFVLMTHFPLNDHGKLDVSKLVQPELVLFDHPRAVRRPHTQMQIMLADIWRELLGTGVVGLDDNFFEMGGHSLLATRFIARIRELFQIKLPLRTLFENAKLEALAALLDDQLANCEGLGTRKSLALKPVTRGKPLPVSQAQRRLWVINQLEGPNPVYNMPFALHLIGPLHVQALERALATLYDRFEILRTHFIEIEGEPHQVIGAPHALPLTLIDISRLQAPTTTRSSLLERAGSWLFDLSFGPLFKAWLLREDSANHVLVLNLHHMISDGWSMGILLEELTCFYQNGVNGTQVTMPDSNVQYADFSVWQNSHLTGEYLAQLIQWWQTYLEDVPKTLLIPTDRPRPPVQTYVGATEFLNLDGDLLDSLKQVARDHNATLFMVLETAFALLLSRYSEAKEILIGTPLAGRSGVAMERMLGFFVNTCVVRNDLRGEPSFGELLGRVKEAFFLTYAHQELPFEVLLEHLQLERNLSFSPLFQVMFALQNAPVTSGTWPGLDHRQMVFADTTAKYDLFLAVWEEGGILKGGIEYNTDLFNRERICRFIGHWQRLLEQIVAHPRRAIGQLQILTQAEHDLLRQPLPVARAQQQLTTRDLFRNQAIKTPNHPALICPEHGRLTYGELLQRVRVLAQALGRAGVGPDVLVAICMQRRAGMVVAMLAIHEAGGAYVPLDPTYPSERLIFMCEDAHIGVLVTDHASNQVVAGFSGHKIEIPTDGKLGDQIGEAMVVQAKPLLGDHLSHLIYTSGSTGRPKGVAIGQESVMGVLRWMRQNYSAELRTGILASTSICFDISVFEIFGGLAWGSTVILAENALQLPELVAKDQVRLINTVPSAIKGLLNQQGIPAGVRAINLAGEPLRGQVVQSIFDLGHVTLVDNLYGPSEDTTYSTCFRMKPGFLGEPLIGKPLEHSHGYVLGEYGDMVPAGIAGELALQGAGLARGYYLRPALTATKFIPNPYGKTPGERLYLTGDWVMRQENGNLKFLGRRDYQVKLRGFRIELEEIEALILSHPLVQEVAVMVTPGLNESQQLVAYLAPGQGQNEILLDERIMRAFLADRLPSHMVPTIFVMMASLPLTANGKINRKALPDPEQALPDQLLVAPNNQNERVLRDIWRLVLGSENFGVTDNFFRLGGDSILAIKIVALARKSKLVLKPKDLFRHQTVRELARVCANQAPPLADQAEIQGWAPLTPIQHWFFEQDLVDAHHFNQSQWLELKQPLDETTLAQVLDRLCTHHDALRLRFRKEQQGWQAVFRAGANGLHFSVFTVMTHADLECDPQITTAIQKVQTCFDLCDGPLIAALLIKHSGGLSDRLLIVAHHLVIDAVSWGILLEDFATIWHGLAIGDANALPPKTTSWKAHGEDLLVRVKTPAIRSERHFWGQSQTLGGWTPDFEGGIHTWADADAITRRLSKTQTLALLQDLPKIYGTEMDDALLTALALAARSQTGQSRLRIHLESHGRGDGEHSDLSRTVGWFTALYPVNLRLRAGEEAGEALLAIRTQLRQMPQKGMGYGMLRYLPDPSDCLVPDSPSPGMSFNYLGQAQNQNLTRGWLKTLDGPAVGDQSPHNARAHLLDMTAVVAKDRLHIHFLYSRKHFRERTIHRLADHYIGALTDLIESCFSTSLAGQGSSGTMTKISQKRLDRLASRFGKNRKS